MFTVQKITKSQKRNLVTESFANRISNVQRKNEKQGKAENVEVAQDFQVTESVNNKIKYSKKHLCSKVCMEAQKNYDGVPLTNELLGRERSLSTSKSACEVVSSKSLSYSIVNLSCHTWIN